MTSPASPVRAPGAAPGSGPRRTGTGAAGAVLAAAATIVLVLTLTASGAGAVVAPGNFKGMGFDACAAPSTRTMNRWMRANENPYRAVGVYISGSMRACDQPNLTRSWVSHQAKMGWHIIPITVGRQASCSGFSKRVSANPHNKYAKARRQARAVARNTVTRARRLGLSKGSTLYYDMEAWHIGYTHCDAATLWFLSAWTRTVNKYGYTGGVYSSGASGIAKLDQVASHRPKGYKLPDYIWFASWNGRETIGTSYIKKHHWNHHQRIHQFLGGHNATNGGVTLNIDSNWLNVRVRGSRSGDTGTTQPTTHRFRCTRAHLTHVSYPFTSAHKHPGYTGTLQCLLRRAGVYEKTVTGDWNKATNAALHTFQKSIGIPVRNAATRRAWTALLVHGIKPTTLRFGDSRPGRAVISLARALNAAVGAGLHGTGYFGEITRGAVKRYNRQVLGKRSGVVRKPTWHALKKGRVGRLASKRVVGRLAALGTDTPKDATFSGSSRPTTASPSASPGATAPAGKQDTKAPGTDPTPSPSAFATAPLDSPDAPTGSTATPGTESSSASPTASPSARHTASASSPAATHATGSAGASKAPEAKPAGSTDTAASDGGHVETYAEKHPVTRAAIEHAVADADLPENAGNPPRSSASGIKAPTRKAAPVRPAVLQAQMPVMDPVPAAARTDAGSPALTARMLLARQLPQVFTNLDVETTRACHLFFPWLED